MILQGTALVSDQLTRILLERIQNGYYREPGEFPSEAQLCKEFGVSRSTVRTALAALVANGLLVKRPGIGTFLAKKHRLESGLEQLESVLSLAKRQSLSSNVANVSINTIEADSTLAETLGVSEGTLLTSVSRTILVDENPVSFHIDFVPRIWLEPGQVDQAFQGSVLDLLRERYAQHVYDAVTEITAIAATRETASYLKIPLHKALILLRETLHEETGTAISYSENYFVPDQVCFRLVRHGVNKPS